MFVIDRQDFHFLTHCPRDDSVGREGVRRMIVIYYLPSRVSVTLGGEETAESGSRLAAYPTILSHCAHEYGRPKTQRQLLCVPFGCENFNAASLVPLSPSF